MEIYTANQYNFGIARMDKICNEFHVFAQIALNKLSNIVNLKQKKKVEP